MSKRSNLRGKKRQREDDDDDAEEEKTFQVCHSGKKYRVGSFQHQHSDPVTELNAIMTYLRLLAEDHNSDSDELSEFLEKCEQILQRRTRFKPQSDHSGITRVMMMFSMIRDCFLSHRYDDAFCVLQTLVHHPLDWNGMTFLRVALEVFHRLSFPRSQLRTFTEHLQFVSDLRIKQICIDEFCFRLSTLPETFQWAKELNRLDNALVVGKSEKHFRRPLRSNWDKVNEGCMFTGNKAVLSYLKLMQAKMEFSSAVARSLPGIEKYERKFANLLQQSLTAFKMFRVPCMMEMGCWDILISKYIELLNCEDKDESCVDGEKILVEYANKNALNPDAWRLLYDFYTLHSYCDEDRFRILKELCDLVPSDPLTEELCELISNGKVLKHCESDSIPVLFNHLDYNPSKSSTWRMLAKIFKSQSDGHEDHEKYAEFEMLVKGQWVDQGRHSWWPSYQFLPPVQDLVDLSTEEHETLSFKAVVACFLLGSKNEFTVIVRNELQNLKFKYEGLPLLKEVEHLPTFSWLAQCQLA